MCNIHTSCRRCCKDVLVTWSLALAYISRFATVSATLLKTLKWCAVRHLDANRQCEALMLNSVRCGALCDVLILFRRIIRLLSPPTLTERSLYSLAFQGRRVSPLLSNVVCCMWTGKWLTIHPVNIWLNHGHPMTSYWTSSPRTRITLGTPFKEEDTWGPCCYPSHPDNCPPVGVVRATWAACTATWYFALVDPSRMCLRIVRPPWQKHSFSRTTPRW